MNKLNPSLIMILLAVIFSSARSWALEIYNTESDGIQLIMISGVFSDSLSTNIFTWHQWEDDVALKSTFHQVMKKNQPMAILITSEGGSRESAKSLADTINRLAKGYRTKRNIPLVTGIIGQCPSACTFFAAALTKGREPTANLILTPFDTPFLFHGPRDFDTGEMLTKEDFDLNLSAGLKQYEESGVNMNWLNRHRGMFRRDHPQGKTFPAAMLCQNGSNILPPKSCVSSYGEIERRLNRIATLGHSPK